MPGKRPRPLMNRSTSMSSSLGELNGLESPRFEPHGHMSFIGEVICSPRYHCDETPQPAHFLDACRLCNRRLGDGRDIYMYRGDTAFCSDECRDQQIAMDERKEKASAVANGVTGMKAGQISSPNNNNGGKNIKGNFQAHAETVAAA